MIHEASDKIDRVMDAPVSRERPILFSAPMVMAILNGSKAQTRRVVKPQPELSYIVDCGNGTFGDEEGDVQFRCPYGQPGDRLWVRESFRMAHGCDHLAPSVIANSLRWYEAMGDASFNYGKLRPSIFMPRNLSRITLEITDVRVERLQDISDIDAIAEGCQKHTTDESFTFGKKTVTGYCGTYDGVYSFEPKHAYQRLWESINGPGSWEVNPWVWVIEFKRSDLPEPAVWAGRVSATEMAK